MIHLREQNLCHQDIPPLNLFERFITSYSIVLRPDGDKARFKAKYSHMYMPEKYCKWIYFNDFIGFLNHCRTCLLYVVCRDVYDAIVDSVIYIPSIFPKPESVRKPETFDSAEEFYDYVYQEKGIVANVLLDNLYLLTHYSDLKIFEDEAVIDEILERIN